jgi:hypothetical protein
LENFIESLGFEPILSEKGDIAYLSEMPLDESCYREAANADIFVLMIGCRYGAEESGIEKNTDHNFFERYESITKKEYENALAKNIPVYILIENSVYSEYFTYLRNKENQNIKYAHVDSVNIFRLIEEIHLRERNNPIQTFERFSDIELWLREQWAGLFREFLQRQTQQKQLASLSDQVTLLRETNSTLQRYLEELMKGMIPEKSNSLIESEQKRLRELEEIDKILDRPLYKGLLKSQGISNSFIIEVAKKANSFAEYAKIIGAEVGSPGYGDFLSLIFRDSVERRRELNALRENLGLTPFFPENMTLDPAP